ncbi:concanavalin A-like lectin/glucanase domain-containing protein [Mycena sp. CBHHK59/15]|nr:concanavalin A-like lectin/glucanase domain-containing protein [Mycena sp. CBHHK59/15]
MHFGQSLSLRLTFLAMTLGLAHAQKYTLSQDLAGDKFFSAFKYNESAVDFNNFGNVHFLSQSAAVAANLTYVDSNGRVIVKVDNTTNGAGDPTFGRNTVYLESNQLMNIGSLLIFDANHIPFGCSVWPSLFTQGQVWPAQGEIDIIENVNLETANRFSLHVGSDTCVQPTSIASNQTGTISTADGDISNCTVTPASGQNTIGCVVTETKPNSFGSGFASQGGGVFAMLWDTTGIAMWYFGRSSVPSDIGGTASPDPTTWGKASAWYPASSCDPTTTFGPQIITLYVDICGAFAGVPSLFASTCGSVAPNCSSMVADPTNYNNAYWEINYLRVFTNGDSPASNASSSGSGSASSTSSGAGSATTGAASAASFGGAGIRELLLVPASLILLGLLSL